MPECERCGAFTDTGRDGEYHYCQDCRTTFADIRENGVVVRGEDEYNVLVNIEGHRDKGGEEHSQVDALARGKLVADELGVDAIFQYEGTGSMWVLSEYLTEHPDIQADVSARLSRVPDDDGVGLLERLRNAF